MALISELFLSEPPLRAGPDRKVNKHQPWGMHTNGEVTGSAGALHHNKTLVSNDDSLTKVSLGQFQML